jgi:hypothetical protein
MSNFVNYKAGLRNVGSYQVSGAPWISGNVDIEPQDEDKFEFPFVTKAVTVINDSGAQGDANGHLRIYFNASSTGDVFNGHHYVTLSGTSVTSVTLNVKCKEIYIANVSAMAGSYTVIAELTGIGADSMYQLTGSGLTDQD